MIYIPDEWIKHKENEEKIGLLLSKATFCIKTKSYEKELLQIEEDLKRLDEEKILEEFKKGTFII